MASTSDSDEENNTLVMNSKLFLELRTRTEIDAKLKNIEKHIAEGADVNASDANDSNNTPLHVAVRKDQPDIVQLLLKKGADSNKLNKNKHTPLDLAIVSMKTNKEAVIRLLEAVILNTDVNRKPIEKQLPVRETKRYALEDEKPAKEKNLINRSRAGTAGDSGQLYEVKLLGLLLLRALHHEDIEEFSLGTNIADIGAFDDIAFKYYLKNEKHPRFFFIQAKHRDNPEKNRITVDSLFKAKGDFSLHKYFESYMKIRHKIKPDSENDMFQASFYKSECSFIIYTPAKELFNGSKLVEIEGEKLLLTSEDGKTFRYKYDDEDIEHLLKILTLCRVSSLAKAFVKNVRGNYKNILRDDLIKEYHVFLSQNVIDICCEHSQYLTGKFRKSFLESNNELLVRIKEIISKELNMSSLSSYEFRLPNGFGNRGVTHNVIQYEELLKVIKKLMKISVKSAGIHKTFVDDSTLSPARFKESDRSVTEKEINILGKFLGDVLIYDENSELLKFNTKQIASESTTRFFKTLQTSEFWKDCDNFKLDINVQGFPKMNLNGIYNKTIVEDFLKNIKFYTDQATEDKVGSLLKLETTNLYDAKKEKNDVVYHIKGDAIYLKYYDSVHNWWKHPDEYQTKFSDFYEKAHDDILISPLINNYHYIYSKNINRYEIKFNDTTVDDLKIPMFIDITNSKVFHVATNDVILTSIKVMQCFQKKMPKENFKFIPLDLVISNGDDKTILSEISDETIDIIVLVLSDFDHDINLFISTVVDQFKKKIIIISSSEMPNILKNNVEYLKEKDQNNSLFDFDISTKTMFIEQTKILFQGMNVKIASFENESILKSVKGKLLDKMMHKDVIKVGKEPTDIEHYCKTKDYYVERRLCRCTDTRKIKYQFDYNGVGVNDISNRPNYNKDVLLTLKEVDECSCSIEPKSLDDLSDRVVVIGGEPGMGKSTFLTHLTIQTKHLHKTLCVMKINLLELKNEFSAWQKNHTEITIKLLISILYKHFSIHETGETMNKMLDSTLVDSNGRIHFNSDKTFGREYDLALFEYQIFIKLYNDDQITLIFDGFDEICPNYKDEALDIFKLILLTSRIRRLWISSRSYMILNELERTLNTISYKLKRFSRKEQIYFLQKFWSKRSPSVLDASVFIDKITKKIRDYGKEFTGAPLHLRMLAEIHLEHSRFGNEIQDFNLISFYKEIVEIKFNKIRFGEKKNWNNTRADPEIQMMIETERSAFINKHKMLAAYSLLDKSKEAGIFTENDLKLINELIQSFSHGEEKTGIIETITQNEVKFVHFSYAEYFACEYICDKLKQHSVDSVCIYLVERILIMDNAGIREYFDAKLETDDVLSHLPSRSICNALLMQIGSTNSALFDAIISKRFNIARFLLRNLETYVNTNNLDTFIDLMSKQRICSCLCQDYDSNNEALMKQIVDIVRRLDCNRLVKLFYYGDIPIFNIFLPAFLHRDVAGKKCNLDLLVRYLNGDHLTKLFVTPIYDGRTTIIHQIAQQSADTLQYLEKLTRAQRMKIFSARDAHNRVAAHYAAQRNDYVFFSKMHFLLGRKDYKAICRLRDNWNDVPFGLALAYNVIEPAQYESIRTIFTEAGFEVRFTDRCTHSLCVLYDLEK